METVSQRIPTRLELRAMAEGLEGCDPAAIDAAVEFFLLDSRGLWHNRARAKFSRRLKHCPLSPVQGQAIVDCVAARLEHGRFPAQFTDQLRLALHLDQARLLHAAERALASPLEHVRRHARWVVAFHRMPDAP